MARREININDFKKTFLNLETDDENFRKNYKTLAGSKNPAHNRYPDILPYDHTIVPLAEKNKDGTPRYINANFIQGIKADREYISCQDPISEQSAENFWLMVLHHDVKLILHLTHHEQKDAEKTYRFWPEDEKTGCVFDKIKIFNEKKNGRVSDGYFEFVITVQKFGHESIQKVKLIQYLNWPAKGAPDKNHFDLFYSETKDEMRRCGYEKPILVTSAAGVGRTGAFIALDLLRRFGPGVCLEEIILKLRKCRMCMVETHEQLKFIQDFWNFQVENRPNRT